MSSPGNMMTPFREVGIWQIIKRLQKSKSQKVSDYSKIEEPEKFLEEEKKHLLSLHFIIWNVALQNMKLNF
jgi:hypothetical protein